MTECAQADLFQQPDWDVAVVGGGPAGLMAAHRLAQAGRRVMVYDAMPSVGRKFLLAGRGGLNLTHSEPIEPFISRYAEQAQRVGNWLQDFGPQSVQDWARGVGIETFVGTSGRIFPTDMKAAPLLRAWLAAMRSSGVQFAMRHRWQGWTSGGDLLFATPEGIRTVSTRATVLALGGASWARLGSDGAWVPWLQAAGVGVVPLKPANCGFDVGVLRSDASEGWTPFFRDKFAGQPFKSVAMVFCAPDGTRFERRGEFVATATGVEGSLVYAASAALREAIYRQGQATFCVDLLPSHTPERVLAELQRPRGSASWAKHLKSRLGLDGIKAAVLHEVLGKADMADVVLLAKTIKAVPLTVVRPRPVDEAISTAGGVDMGDLTDDLMCRVRPGLFVAGEMLDWEAPTGGYLLTAALASGVRVAQGVDRYLQK